MPRPVPVRGVIEGFYGPPWPPDARSSVIEFVAEHAMNAYVYAPKDESKHRARWREPYDDAERAGFRDLAERGAELGVRVGYAISPGLDVDYASDPDRAALLQKVTSLLDVGIGWIILALDDIPARPGLAADHARLCAWLLAALRGRDSAATLALVPTEYVGIASSPYLTELGRALPPEVDVMWTGSTVCAPTITARDARARAAALGGRTALLWDNYPVNDGIMDRGLHLGPYRGREPELTDAVVGVLCNPMVQPHASKVALATAADFLADPSAYDPNASWTRAIAAVSHGRRGALGALARACADGPVSPPERLVAHELVSALATALDGPNWPGPLAALRHELEALHAAPSAWAALPGDPLGDELAPWLAQAVLEAGAGLAALRLVERVHGDTDVDAERAMLAAFGVLSRWAAARRGDRRVLGPRFATYPAVVQLAHGRPALDVDLAIVEDRNVTDRLCRLALAAYATWCRAQQAA